MERSEPMPERRVQPAAGVGDDNLLDSLLDEEKSGGEEGSLIATLMDDEEEEEEVERPGAGLRLAPMAGGAEPMSHMDGSSVEEDTPAQAMEPATEQVSSAVEDDDQISDEGDDAADQLLALQKQVAELTKAIKHEEEMAGEAIEEEFLEEEFAEEEFIEEEVPETRRRRSTSSVAPMATRDGAVRTPSRASPARRAMAAAPVASSKSRRVQEEDEEEEDDEMEGGRRSSTLDTYRLLLETVWVDDLLDPAEVDLLRRKRIELGIDFETHLKMTREMLGGLD